MDDLRVSSYDRGSSLLVALIIIIGFFVAIMLIIWMTRVLMFYQQPVPVTLVDESEGYGEPVQGYDREIEEPGLEELEVIEPTLETDLEALTDIVTTQLAALDQLDTPDLRSGRGSGLGDNRRAGPGGDGDVIPRWERWQVRFSANSMAEYARQLDHFGIELAAVGGGRQQVDYARSLSQPQPVTRSAPGDQEKRLYMTWTTGTLSQFDRRFLSQAGVTLQNRIVLQFYPAEVENRLAALELQHAGGRTVKQIQKTVFGVRSAGSGYEFYVIAQTYRNVPS